MGNTNSEIKGNRMSKSNIGGLKALASHGSERSSRERALARSLASSIYIHMYICPQEGVYEHRHTWPLYLYMCIVVATSASSYYVCKTLCIRPYI